MQAQAGSRQPLASLDMTGGVRVMVLDSLDIVTRYVLEEQHDWFEDEIRFVRTLLQLGGRAIDIGANFGVYTLSIARLVGPEGHVWAFEPSASTADCLAHSIGENGFANVTLDRRGVSDASGNAELAQAGSPELNGIIRGAHVSGPTQRIEVSSLDEMRIEYGWSHIDFIKIDAEGEERRIIDGARQFLAQCSPLIQFEVRAGAAHDQGLAIEFEKLGYRSYRLVPGIGVLAPVDPSAALDGFSLNLFCCKPDREAELAARGLLVPESEQLAREASGSASSGANRIADCRSALARFRYAAILDSAWQSSAQRPGRADVERAIALHALSRSVAEAPSARLAALRASLEILRGVCSGAAPSLRLASLARVARDCGERQLAVESLHRLLAWASQSGGFDLSEPFLSPCPHHEQVDPGTQVANWALSAALEASESLSSFSSYYSARTSLPRLSALASIGFASPEMARRLKLVEARLGSQRPK